MWQLIVRRLALLPLLLWIIYTVTFVFAWMIPGDPTQRDESRRPPKEIQDAIKAQYNLDDPVSFYVEYLADATGIGYVLGQREHCFDLGPSLQYIDWRVSEIIREAMPVSVQLGLAAIVVALAIGVTAGVLGALRPGGALDWASLSVALVGISLPTFVTGTVLLLIFALVLRWLPVGGWAGFRTMILPTLTLSLPFAAYIARLTRMGMIDVLNSDFIRTARAKGLSERRVIMKHALKVAFLPVLSFLGPAAAAAMTGSFVVEEVFNVPGMGHFFVAAVKNGDLFLIMGVVLVYATMLIVFNLLVDITYHLIDPRIQFDH